VPPTDGDLVTREDVKRAADALAAVQVPKSAALVAACALILQNTESVIVNDPRLTIVLRMLCIRAIETDDLGGMIATLNDPDDFNRFVADLGPPFTGIGRTEPPAAVIGMPPRPDRKKH
jgi:hypothetical protein